MMNHYDDYVEYDDQQANNFPQIDILELGENDLKQFFQPRVPRCQIWSEKFLVQHLSGTTLIMTCTYFTTPLYQKWCAHIFRFLHFLVYRNAGDPVVKFSPRLHMVSSTFCIQIQIQSIQLLFLFLLAIRPPTYKISITCRFFTNERVARFFEITKKVFPISIRK